MYTQIQWDASDEFMGATEAETVIVASRAARTRRAAGVRARLHLACVLYANAETLEQRMQLLDDFQAFMLGYACDEALDLLRCGWRGERERQDAAA
jgi:hypothetical protein